MYDQGFVEFVAQKNMFLERCDLLLVARTILLAQIEPSFAQRDAPCVHSYLPQPIEPCNLHLRGVVGMDRCRKQPSIGNLSYFGNHKCKDLHHIFSVWGKVMGVYVDKSAQNSYLYGKFTKKL